MSVPRAKTVVAIQSPSFVWLCTLMSCNTPDFGVLHCLLEFAQIHVHWGGDAIQPSYPLSHSSLALNLSQHKGRSFPMSRLFTSGDQSVGASASASVLPKNIQGWFRTVWLDLLSVQGTLKRLLQHHTWEASILRRLAFFMVQLTSIRDSGKAIALTRQTFVGKILSLLFNMLSRFVIAFLPRSKCLLI